MANVAKYVEDYKVALKKKALQEEKRRKVVRVKAAKGKGRHVKSSSEGSDEDNSATETGESQQKGKGLHQLRKVTQQPAAETETVDMTREQVAAPEPIPNMLNVATNIQLSGGTGADLMSSEPPLEPHYSLRKRK
ncbi:hypothetical protein BYT27DRAFT_7088546 [Phlegmacium glaucopus]|nr:hypothetical protein BYT27DRAFT_7088546 [Phlegmacium glaucopus]